MRWCSAKRRSANNTRSHQVDRTVPDSGPESAAILIVGEAPGKEEMRHGYPFAGASGRMLRSWLTQVGLERTQAYVTNVLGAMPDSPGGDLDLALKQGTVTEADIHEGFDYVKRVAASLPNLSVICPVGNYATAALSPVGKTRLTPDRPGITSVRGSVYPFGTLRGRQISVVPSIHPAAVMRQPVWEKRCIADWARIASLVDQPYTPPPRRDHMINPSLKEVEDWCYSILIGREVVGLDIETWGNTIQCVGLATQPYQSLTIPTTRAYWRDAAAYTRAWDAIRYVVEHEDIELCMQNGLFDAWWLEQAGLRVRGYLWDTLDMHHALDPVDSHSLDYMASIYTRQPYWKDEAKQADEIVRIAKDVGMDRLYVYNGLDVTVMMELLERFQDQLAAQQMMPFYFRHYGEMRPVLLQMMRQGIGVDRQAMAQMHQDYLDQARRLRDECGLIAGRDLFRFNTTRCEKEMLELYNVDQAWCSSDEFEDQDGYIYPKIRQTLLEQGHPAATIKKKWAELGRKQISDTELRKLLFTEWRAPKPSATETGQWQVDNVALKSTALKAQARARLPEKDRIVELIPKVIAHRRAAKLAAFLKVERLDDDDRMRCEYRFATRSGRLASRENPRGTGSNLQNYDRELLSVFIPRPGNVFVEADLSQAESRVVKVLTGDPTMARIAGYHPTEYDEHRHNAAIIFSKLLGYEVTPLEVTYDQRQLGKRVNHAANYAIGKNELSRTILRETGDALTPAECQTLLSAHLEAWPQILEYQSRVRRAILLHEGLYTSWGRRVNLRGVRKDEELYKFGYSYIPQSEVGDLTNQYGLIPLHAWITDQDLPIDICGQKHDSILVDTPPEYAWDVMAFLESHLSAPRTYGECLSDTCELAIPVELKMGCSWAMSHEWKCLPTKDEILETAHELLRAA